MLLLYATEGAASELIRGVVLCHFPSSRVDNCRVVPNASPHLVNGQDMLLYAFQEMLAAAAEGFAGGVRQTYDSLDIT